MASRRLGRGGEEAFMSGLSIVVAVLFIAACGATGGVGFLWRARRLHEVESAYEIATPRLPAGTIWPTRLGLKLATPGPKRPHGSLPLLPRKRTFSDLAASFAAEADGAVGRGRRALGKPCSLRKSAQNFRTPWTTTPPGISDLLAGPLPRALPPSRVCRSPRARGDRNSLTGHRLPLQKISQAYQPVGF